MKNLKYLLVVCLLVACMTGLHPAETKAAALKAKISVDCGDSAMIGDTITIKGGYSGGTGTKKYKFKYKFKDVKYTIAPYGTAKTATFVPKKNGTYTFYTYVKANGVVATKTTKVVVKDLAATIALSSNGYINNKVKVTAGSVGGWGTKEYKISYHYDGVKTVLQNYSDVASVKFVPGAAGVYKVNVTAKDGMGRKVTISKKITMNDFENAEMALRQKLVDTANKWYGVKEGSAGHKEIVKVYNSEKNNLYRLNSKTGKYVYGHYDASIKDAWCDIFTSACFIKAKMQVISGVECGCESHIYLLNKKYASFVENDAYVPTMGDIIFYDWQDNGKGDCTGHADHVGIVISCDGKNIKVIEGNMDLGNGKDGVGYRTVKVNDKCIRGFGVPNYKKLVAE